MKETSIDRQSTVGEEISMNEYLESMKTEAVADAQDKKHESSLGCVRFVKPLILPVIIIAVVSGLLVHFLNGNEVIPPALQNVIPDIELFRGEDPTDGEVHRWSFADGVNGLRLTVINALTDEWHPYFDTAIQQWDNGTPDALTLTTETSFPDPECNVEFGALKICNDNYGETDWKGVNKLYMQDGVIRSSVGKMNEFYFEPGKEDAKRQYTMCHEIGHGFGLPHTDERFWNRDQGNCMDYTNRPQNNKQPDEVNFETLAGVYGLVANNTISSNVSPTINNFQPQAWSNQQPWENNEKDNKDEKDKDKDDRYLRAIRQKRVEHGGFPLHIAETFRSLDPVIDAGVSVRSPGWRKLHETMYSRALEFELADGYSIQVHYLLN